MRKWIRSSLLLALCLSLSGCIFLTPFDPSGQDVSLSGEWHIDRGFGPEIAGRESCAAAGISEIELRIYDDEFSTYYTDESLRFPCAQASFVTPPRLLFGRYRTRWLAYDIAGFEVARSEKELLDAQNTAHVNLPPPTFIVVDPIAPASTDLNLALSWDTNIGPGIAPGTCAAAKVDTLHYMLRDEFGALIAEGDAPCTESLIFEELSHGTYSVEILGAEAGAYAWSGLCGPVYLDGLDNEFNCVIERQDW